MPRRIEKNEVSLLVAAEALRSGASYGEVYRAVLVSGRLDLGPRGELHYLKQEWTLYPPEEAGAGEGTRTQPD